MLRSAFFTSTPRDVLGASFTFSERPSNSRILGLSVPFDHLQSTPTVFETYGNAYHRDVPASLSSAAGNRAAFASVAVTGLKGRFDPRGSPSWVA